MAETGARLLVADDNKVNRLLLARSLELQGHRVASAENGRVALEMLRREAFDLLLLDMEMPEMNGFEVLEHLAADRQLRDLPVIVTCSLEGRDPCRALHRTRRRRLPAQAGEPGAAEGAHRLQPGEEAPARPAEGAGAALRHQRGGARTCSTRASRSAASAWSAR